MESIGFSQNPRQRLPRQRPMPDKTRPGLPAQLPDETEVLRRMNGDRMQIRKTQAMPQPNWTLIFGVLFGVALSLGAGVGLGGGMVAIGIGLGWLSIALVALIWHELGIAYQVFQSRQ